MGTRHLLQESGSEIRRLGRSAGGALRGATGVYRVALQNPYDLVVRGRRKVVVPLADGMKMPWRVRANDLVGHCGQVDDH